MVRLPGRRTHFCPRDDALAARGLQICAFEIMKARRRGTDGAPRRDVNVVVELVERALEVWIVTDARSHLDEPRRRLHPVTMRRNVVEVWIRPARCYGDEDCSDAGSETNGQS